MDKDMAIKIKQEKKNKSLVTKRINFGNKRTQKFIDAVLNKVSSIDEDVGFYEREKIREDITIDIVGYAIDLGKYDLDITTDRIQQAINEVSKDAAKQVNGHINKLDDRVVTSIVDDTIKGVNYSDRIWKNKEKLAQDINKDIKKHLLQEGQVDKVGLTRDLKRRQGVDTHSAARLINNEVARVENATKLEIYRENEIEDVEFVAVMDDVTTDICINLDGTVYDINDPSKPNIPEDTHIGCRSMYRPRYKRMEDFSFIQ